MMDDGKDLPKTLTYFPFFAAEGLTNVRVRAMAPAARAGLIDLLAWAWRHDDCALPAAETALAALSGLGAEWPTHRAAILPFFPLLEGDATRRRSATLYRRYLDALDAHEKRVAAANVRWSGRRGARTARPSPPPSEEAPEEGAGAFDLADAPPALAGWVGESDVRRSLLRSLAEAFGDASAIRAAFAEMNARLTGMHGKPLDGAALEDATLDFLAKHADKRPGFSGFKRFLSAAANPPEPLARERKPSPAMLGESAAALAEKYL